MTEREELEKAFLKLYDAGGEPARQAHGFAYELRKKNPIMQIHMDDLAKITAKIYEVCSATDLDEEANELAYECVSLLTSLDLKHQTEVIESQPDEYVAFLRKMVAQYQVAS